VWPTLVLRSNPPAGPANQRVVNTINTINKKKKEAKKKNYDYDSSILRKPGHFYSLATELFSKCRNFFKMS